MHTATTPLRSLAPLAFVAAAALSPLLGCDAEDFAVEDQDTEAVDLGEPDLREPAGEEPEPAATQLVTLRLDTRDGVSALGWSLASQALVPEAAANLSIASSDCGARGRWVQLQSRDMMLCELGTHADESDPTDCAWLTSVEIGGSDAEPEFGSRFLAMRDGVIVARLTLVDRTTLADNWYMLPITPFDVVLDVELLPDPE
ncbi:hypothetical protein [Enhygromyxa salina]|uniref:Uncharacterized protein n=1 Tax=Enhygromyxa salina TaxID=215803 RepID=A0A2S9YUQ8_9BACT|nr:hypothetical protein [Enhygromyxa salina]PRQ08772.1 hypothetical protein ENSA7_14040 [Enhygromyxa salina]